MDVRAALIEETAAFGELIRTRRSDHSGSDLSRIGRSGSCSATSAAETGGRHRSSPTGATRRSIPAKCATASRPTMPTRQSTG